MLKEKKLSLQKILLILSDRHERVKALSKEEKRNYYMGVYFLHGIEILILILILGYFISPLFFYLFVGFAFHLLLDTFHGVKLDIPLYKISIIRDFYKFKKLKRFR